jgi:hypothetical protein
MAIVVVALFAGMILAPVGAAWFANRAGMFAVSPEKNPRIIGFPLSRFIEPSRHRHTDAA